MKLLKYFDSFLANEVNLNQGRLDSLNSRVDAVESFLSSGDHEIAGRFLQLIPQGSYAHGTIIKPVGQNDEFDADVLLELEENLGWSPDEYVEALYRSFRSSSTYKDMVSRRTRCVTVDYANDFHIDVVPYMERHGEHYITNRKENLFELTNPEGYNAWLDDKNRVAGGKLVKVIRLLKYLRDYKNTFSVPSVILNILIAERIDDAALLEDPDHYKDIPTILKNVLADLDTYLDSCDVMPTIADPSCPTESFNHRWTEELYSNFAKWIKYYSSKVADAYDDPDKALSISKWQSIFGNDFGTVDLVKSARAEAHIGRARNTEEFLDSHFKIPTVINFSYRFRLAARDLPLSGPNPPRNPILRARGNFVKPRRKVRFTFESCTVPEPYEVYWKVRNFGEEAIAADCIRGQIVKDEGFKTLDEPTQYRGRHYVECYIVKDGVCVAKDRQPVVIV